jgi:hypothetical protein
MRVGIPVSETEFLLFDPSDLAMYYRVTFNKLADGGVSLTMLRADWEPVATATKAK